MLLICYCNFCCKIYFLDHFELKLRYFGVQKSGFGDLRYFRLWKWVFSYINSKNIFLYWPVKARLGKVMASSVKNSCKRGFWVPKSLPCYPVLIGNFEPENGSFNRDFEAFSVPTSKVPNFNFLWGVLFGSNDNFHLIGTSYYDV